jgi:hypothetical protein
VKSSAVRADLDSMVVGIELTLISITQGVALFFLIDNARATLSVQSSGFWIYVATGLLIVLTFWSRAILHTLTLIRWPLEFGHNFLYIVCTVCESLLFTRLNQPQGWFALGALYAAIVWLLFMWDRRLIRARGRDSGGNISNRLYQIVSRDQRLNIRVLVPMLFLLSLAAALCVGRRPDSFLLRGGHFWLALVQLGSFVVYLVYVVRFYVVLTPLIAGAREEWRSAAVRDD